MILGAETGVLKIRVSVVRFRPWPPSNQKLRRGDLPTIMEYPGWMEKYSRDRVSIWIHPTRRLREQFDAADNP